MRIANRLFLWFAVLTVCVAFSVFLCLSLVLRPSLQKAAYASLEETARSDLRAIEQSIQSANAVSVNITYSARIREAMRKLNENGSLSHTELIGAAEQLVAINGTMFPVIQIRLYPDKGSMLASGMVNGQYPYRQQELTWLPEVTDADGFKVISAPYRDMSLSKQSYVIALRRAFKLSSRQAVGAVEVVMDARSAFAALEAEPNGSSYLLDASGEVLYPYGGVLDDDVLRKALEGGTEGIAEARRNGTEVLAAWRGSQVAGWKVIAVRERSEVLKPLERMMLLTLGITVALLGMALLLAYILSRQFTQPIGLLADKMRAFTLSPGGSERAEVPEADELKALDQAFELLKADLTRSVRELLLTREKELQSHMLALQSQMNPHFLHNALGNLQAVMELGDTDRAARLIDGMSRMLRYVASDEHPVVKLSDELKHARDYMDWMHVRYGDNLRFEVDAGDLPEDTQVPKLSIQPLVENAIKYGCTGQPPWRVSLKLSRYEQGWRADVADDGPGFDRMTLETLLDSAERLRRVGVLPTLKIDGMGLINIAMRLRLYQGEDFLFHIQNLDGGGCVVSIGSPRAQREGRGIDG